MRNSFQVGRIVFGRQECPASTQNLRLLIRNGQWPKFGAGHMGSVTAKIQTDNRRAAPAAVFRPTRAEDLLSPSPRRRCRKAG